MSDIFLSYASEDRVRIMPLVRALEKTGWSVFWDRTIPTGKTWREVIGGEIRSCRSIVVVWSKTSIDSRWVQEEADEGSRRHILFPVLLEDVELPFGFGSIQAASLINWDGKPEAQEFRRLISDLTGLLGERPAVADEVKHKAEVEEKIKLETERKQKAEKEAKQKAAEEEKYRKEKETSRKIEESWKRKKVEAVHKAEEDRKPKDWGQRHPILGGLIAGFVGCSPMLLLGILGDDPKVIFVYLFISIIVGLSIGGMLKK